MTDLQSNKAEHDSIAAGHEADTASVQRIALAILGLTLLAVMALIVVWGITEVLSKATKTAEALSAVPPVELVTPPLAEPRLDANQPQELRELRTREVEQLASYGWVDFEADVAHIPIERAIQLVTERGLPEWADLSRQQLPQQPTDAP